MQKRVGPKKEFKPERNWIDHVDTDSPVMDTLDQVFVQAARHFGYPANTDFSKPPYQGYLYGVERYVPGGDEELDGMKGPKRGVDWLESYMDIWKLNQVGQKAAQKSRTIETILLFHGPASESISEALLTFGFTVSLPLRATLRELTQRKWSFERDHMWSLKGLAEWLTEKATRSGPRKVLNRSRYTYE